MLTMILNFQKDITGRGPDPMSGWWFPVIVNSGGHHRIKSVAPIAVALYPPLKFVIFSSSPSAEVAVVLLLYIKRNRNDIGFCGLAWLLRPSGPQERWATRNNHDSPSDFQL
ncbi:hypothetical protein C4J81_14675 [Deltaproteobacteria bacterium Smac51]|nr:hypothetical protein C4J81_14675 [Deltaproteobacteria bacterium Smac51]